MSETKTVSPDSTALYVQQCEDVAAMRASLMSFNRTDPQAARKAMQNITILRVYHQLTRIIRYTEIMDRIEAKMYEAIENTLNDMDEFSVQTWIQLAALQEKLQKSMIESHKLLEPYLDMSQLGVIEQEVNDPSQSFNAVIFEQESREKIKTSAQQALAAIGMLDKANSDSSEGEVTPSDDTE